MIRFLVLALWASSLAACAIPDDDALAGIGQPCKVSEALCSLDLVCRPTEPGGAEGLCEPVPDYGACAKPEHLPGRFGTVEDAITIDEPPDLVKLDGVRLVQGRVLLHNRITEVDIGDVCPARALQRVGDGLFIGNTAITNVDGLGSVTSVVNGLAIFGNRTLTNLNGLAHLVDIDPCSVGTTSVQVVIANNNALPASEVVRFAEQLEQRMGKAPQLIHCGNGPPADSDPPCGADASAIVLSLQDSGELCQ